MHKLRVEEHCAAGAERHSCSREVAWYNAFDGLGCGILAWAHRSRHLAGFYDPQFVRSRIESKTSIVPGHIGERRPNRNERGRRGLDIGVILVAGPTRGPRLHVEEFSAESARS